MSGTEACTAPSAAQGPLMDRKIKHAPILALAPNGAYKQKVDHPAVPMVMHEIVQTAVQAQLAGATLLHLHIRDENGFHSLNRNTYQRTIDAIRDQVGNNLIIQITSEAAGRYSPSQQIATIRAVNPQCVSVALREIIPEASLLPAAQALFDWCAEQQCRIQYILYNESDLLSYLEYRKQGIIPAAPHSTLFVLGRYTQSLDSSEADLVPFLQHRKRFEAPWMVCAFGRSEQRILLDAVKNGGHIRIGFENNLLSPDGSVAHDNIQQLRTITRAIRAADSTIATVQVTRQVLDIR